MKSWSIQEINIEDFAPKLIQTEGANRIPLMGTLELTFRCNNRCVHCYVNKRMDSDEERAKELTRVEICRILDNLADDGCLWLLLTGGEPLTRKDFPEIYLYGKKKGFLITLFTNGTLITPWIADLLEEFPPRSIEITLYGVTEKTYEGVTRSPGSFERCRKGIDLLLERNLPLLLKTVIVKQNKHEFMSTKEFVEGLGLEFKFDALINGRLNGGPDITKLRIAPREVIELDMTDPRRGPEFVRLHERTSTIEQDPDLLYCCSAGVNSFHIDPYGQLTPCIIVRDPSYDLRRGSFREGWHDFLPRIRTEKLKRKNKCVECDLRPICDQCPGWSQLEHGDPEIPVEYLCQVAHLRAQTFGIGKHGSVKQLAA